MVPACPGLQKVLVSGLLPAERVLIPHHPFLRAQRPHKNSVHKDLRLHGGEFGRKRYPRQVVDIVLFKKKRLFLERGKHGRSGFRLHHGARMGVKGDDDA